MFELLPDGRRIYTDGNHTVQQDALLLAGFVRLRPGLRAADIGCGCGTVGFRLLTRGLESIELVDCSEAACTLARRTATEGGFAAAVTEADARRWTPARKLDLLVCNPPYFLAGRPSPDPERRRARHNGSFTLDDLGRCARRALALPPDRMGTAALRVFQCRTPDTPGTAALGRRRGGDPTPAQAPAGAA